MRENLTWALVRMGDAAVTPLIDLLSDADPLVRHQAAHVLSKIGDRRAVNALIDALRDDDATVMTKAVFALGLIGDDKAIPALVSLVGHESRELQSTLASALERFGLPAMPLIVEALQDERWQVREQAASILGLIGSANAVPALIAASTDQHWQVRFASAQALGAVGGEIANEAVQSMRDDPDARVRSLVERHRSRGPVARRAIARSRPPNTTA